VSTDEYETNCGAEVLSANTEPVLCPKKVKSNAIRTVSENPTSDFKPFTAECSFEARSSLPAGGKNPPDQPNEHRDDQRKDRQNWIILFSIRNIGPHDPCDNECRDSSRCPVDGPASAHSVPRNLLGDKSHFAT